MKKALAVLLAVLFVPSLTAVTASARWGPPRLGWWLGLAWPDWGWGNGIGYGGYGLVSPLWLLSLRSIWQLPIYLNMKICHMAHEI